MSDSRSRSRRERYGTPERAQAAKSAESKVYVSKSIEDLTLLTEPEIDLTQFRRSSTPRALARYVGRRADFTFSSAYLEGTRSFTLPEVQTLIDSGSIPSGKPVADVDQILALTEASEKLYDDVNAGTFLLRPEQSDSYNAILVRHEAIDAGIRRIHSRVNPDGRGASVNIMGDRFEALRLDQLREAESVLLERIHAISHPLVRAINYAAATSYLQMYFDGNKRTARYMMDGEFMSHGFDAIAIPARREREYHESLARMFRTGDVTPYACFLLDVAQRGDPVA